MHGLRSPLTDIKNRSAHTNTPHSLNDDLLPPLVTIGTVTIIDNTSPLPNPHITLQRDPSPLQTTLTLSQSSSSHLPLRRTFLFRLSVTASHSPATFRGFGMLGRSHRNISIHEERDREHSTASSMTGLEESLLPLDEPSPTPSEIDKDLTCFPPFPPESEEIQHKEYEAPMPHVDQIN
jgi:hypothetical protein